MSVGSALPSPADELSNPTAPTCSAMASCKFIGSTAAGTAGASSWPLSSLRDDDVAARTSVTDGKGRSSRSIVCALPHGFTGLPSTAGRLDFLLTFSNGRFLPTPPYTNPPGRLDEFFPTITPVCKLIFFTVGPLSVGCAERGAIKVAGPLPEA